MADDRQQRALEMRLAGATFAQIAQQLGYADESGAYRAVQSMIAKHRPVDEEVITLELARLDALQVAVWSHARSADYAAIDRALKISERRMELLGTPITRSGDHSEEESGLDEFTRHLRDRKAGA